jgi:dTDP-4-amino-4,6-dideoxygalactose transaminase
VSRDKRVYLSPPHLTGRELELVRDAFESNWVAPLGPHVDAFEREFAQAIGVPHAVALSSGTAALHLALRILAGNGDRGLRSAGLGPGAGQSSEVICSTLTFAATAFAITYEGAVPVFVDSDSTTWNMDPALLRDELCTSSRQGRLPRAVVAVDLYGQCADYDPIVQVCEEFGVPLIEDAAEALGATYLGWDEPRARDGRDGCESETAATGRESRTRGAGSFGSAAAFSFNGNKILTTSGGGMLVSHDRSIIDRARFLATQARDPVPHYLHSEVGFNYRMSNILAAVGRRQLAVLPDRVAARRRNFEFYRSALGDLPGIQFMPEAAYGRSTRWLTCLTIDPAQFCATREDVRLALEAENIEVRPVWMPMHLQPVFKGCRVRGGAVSERLFERGLCLPSGSALTERDLERVCTVVKKAHRAAGARVRRDARSRPKREVAVRPDADDETRNRQVAAGCASESPVSMLTAVGRPGAACSRPRPFPLHPLSRPTEHRRDMRHELETRRAGREMVG